MRVLHTSDWHLGRRLGEHSLLGEQQKFCDWLVRHVSAEGVDLVAISGDLFDRPIPPTEAIDLLSDTLRRLRDAGARVAAIAGNHDSATRLAMADGFTEAGGLYLRGGFPSSGPVTQVEIGGDRLQLVTVPYLGPHMAPASVREELRSADVAVTHETVLARALAAARDALVPGVPSLVLSHAFVTSAAPSPSERDLAVGDAAMVSVEVFDGFDYVALGHLHQPQAVRGNPHIRYSGSPLPYSFSETAPKSVVVVEYSGAGLLSVEPREIPVGRRVVTVRGELAQLVEGPGNSEDWVRAELSDGLRPMDAARELRRNHPHLAQVEWLGSRSEPTTAPAVSVVETASPHELMLQFWSKVRGEAPGEEISALIAEALRGDEHRDSEGLAA